jgi:DNA-binding Lrp family transcriptional regulator
MELLDDPVNLRLLEKLVSGEATSPNLSLLSKRLGRHRNTIRDRVEELLHHRVLDRPVFPFLGLYKEYPLLIAVRADIPNDEQFRRWISTDEHIFAAFRSRQGEYNTLLFLFHKDVTSYQLWRESLVPQGKIPPREFRYPSSTSYFSTHMMVKYEPSSAIKLIEEDVKRNGEIEINGCRIDGLSFEIMKALVLGEGIRVNENFLSKSLGIHRRTVSKRIEKLIEEGLIGRPVCRFPNFFVPPNYILVFSLYEIRKSREAILEEIRGDPHVPIAINVSHGRYNLLMFSNHRSITDHLEWEERYEARFPNCFGSADITYLSPKMTVSIDQQKVSLGIIRGKLRKLEGGREPEGALPRPDGY